MGFRQPNSRFRFFHEGMEHIKSLPETRHIHQPIGVSIETLAKLRDSRSGLRKWFHAERSSSSCNCRNRWPKESFTGPGRPDISSLLLPIQIMTRPDNCGWLGKVVPSVPPLSGVKASSRSSYKHGKFAIFRQALLLALCGTKTLDWHPAGQ